MVSCFMVWCIEVMCVVVWCIVAHGGGAWQSFEKLCWPLQSAHTLE